MRTFLIIILSIVCFSMNAQEDYFVNAKNGLNVRADKKLGSKKMTKLPFGVTVKKLKDESEEITIKVKRKRIKGKWVKIKYNNYLYLLPKKTKHEQYEGEGYVFDAYLKKKKEGREEIDTFKITEKEFIRLRGKRTAFFQKSEKITDLNSIKKRLKNRVTWITSFEDEAYKREDAIKSIITNKGKELIINQMSNDYGFNKDFSGYYPKYDILVLEGGHSSDACFSIKTGATQSTVGNPDYIIPSPKNTYRLNGYESGQECILYFFQKKEKGEFIYLTDFNIACRFVDFYWIDETTFIYSIINYRTDSIKGVQEYFKGELKI